MISHPCFVCGAAIEGETIEAYGDAGFAHARAAHPDEVAPFPDMAVHNFFEGQARMTGGSDRLDEIGDVEIHPVTEDRIGDWLDFFDHHAMVDVPQNSACYCLEPHELSPRIEPGPMRHWRERREDALALVRGGTMFGYLAYVDGRPAAWVNASRRADTTLFRRGDDVDAQTAAVACFAVAPPYRRHGLARQLLARVVADAPGRGLDAVEAYPPRAEVPAGVNYRGGRAMYDAAGFTPVKERSYDTVVRYPVRQVRS
jgi:GNAT superfamily N-acetyltransferase